MPLPCRCPYPCPCVDLHLPLSIARSCLLLESLTILQSPDDSDDVIDADCLAEVSHSTAQRGMAWHGIVALSFVVCPLCFVQIACLVTLFAFCFLRFAFFLFACTMVRVCPGCGHGRAKQSAVGGSSSSSRHRRCVFCSPPSVCPRFDHPILIIRERYPTEGRVSASHAPAGWNVRRY